MGKLTARGAQTAKDGMHADGGNLYLLVRNNGAGRSWVFRYTRSGRVVQMGLGSASDRSLASARELAAKLRQALADGRDPKAELDALLNRRDDVPTFAEAAERLIEAKREGWRNPKHAAQWANTLQTYAYPVIGRKRPADVTLDDVLRILSPVWSTKTETATRLRQRLEAVLDFCAVHGWRTDDNPARWRGKLDKVLPSPQKLKKRKHFAAVPYPEVPAVMDALRHAPGIAALCLRFIILTGSRSSESRGARWDEIDLERATWSIPGDRMKAGKPHRVPLSDEALAVLKQAAAMRMVNSPFVFPGPNTGRALWDVSVSAALHAIRPDATVHGFRASFKTWASETARYPARVVETALAHVNPNKTEAAYERTDVFELRRSLMADWGRHCCPPKDGAEVVPMRRAG
jgi:integrase